MTEQEILLLLNQNYDIKFSSVRFLRKGGGLSYSAESDSRQYFMKIVSNAFSETALYSVKIQNFLYLNGIPVPEIILTKKNNLYFSDGENIFILYEYIDGHEPSLSDCAEQIGELVSKLHKVMEHYPDKPIMRGKEFFVDRYIEILRKKNYAQNKIKRYTEIGNDIWKNVENLTYGYCHGDLHRGNILQHGETLYILDFDTVCRAPLMFDIAVMCDTTDYFNFNEKEFRNTTDIFNRFMSAYSTKKFDEKLFYEFIALRHFQLQATIIEIYGIDCIDDKFIDSQLEWIEKWRALYN